ncbi:MAG: aminotransferase class I/II-fold pyridoxal phosphate-dependent enzyme [Winogradskyella sp.]|uniref:aminotransferase class I/II-fold pyridoxal phosphate-dependent enzyme n=1 Tax=Winogradskyella sp. TaxID=1883156 RepID=UPI0017C68A23|nr:aminotransferase class I/II-fold pyridoxal phosphate-dependent enzyme [Winogradskyella sp.]MBT8243611.1 aminotransferase class I/II-fold pyridoxal phosphate-dependent enzyme [Winogradskyella sp.]NNK23845.1 aminotransferase class I/II-fold pyridoxal phosphate-dependent enzyme [Winogradskyella sp.]
MIEVADRLKQVEEYYFSVKLKEVAFLKSQGKPIINLGIGSPDLDPPLKAVMALEESLHHAGAHKYQSYQGIPQFRDAVADFYKARYKVSLSAKTEVLPLMGSKEGVMHISMAFLNKGDCVLIPNPGYPTYASVAKLLEAEPIFYDLKEDNNWLPDFIALERMDLSKVKIMWTNYPNMPTGSNAPHKFYDDVIAFGKRHDILIVNDNPYSFILNDNPKSILQYRNSKDVCLELNSISKTFNMAGWRAGMVVGNYDYVNAVLKVKSNMDSGMFYGIQKGAIEALKSSNMWFESLNSIYRKRRKLVRELAEALNCTCDDDVSGLFVWAKLPPHIKSEEFTDLVLKEHNIFIAPGTVFGSNGEGYVRFSICEEESVINEAIARVK